MFVGGAVVQWLRDELKIVATAAETEAVAAALPDNGDVYFVPAFTGLGAPWWDMYGRGTLIGLTRGTGRAHIVRAALEAIAYQSADVINAMASDSSMKSTVLRVDGKPCYALEGSVFVGGAVVQWLRDEIKLVSAASETEAVAMEVADNGNVYFVPAFTGLGAPHWDMYSRGAIVGLTRGTGRAHIVRAALESIAYQSADVIAAMANDAGTRPEVLLVDGGASANNFLMQFQSDILGARVVRPKVIETTAKGAAMLAGRAVGVWSTADLNELGGIDREFSPAMTEDQRQHLLRQWHRAVERSRGWAEA